MTELARASSNCKRHIVIITASVQLKKILVVGFKGLGAKTN
jgi:hypothetical protein